MSRAAKTSWGVLILWLLSGVLVLALQKNALDLRGEITLFNQTYTCEPWKKRDIIEFCQKYPDPSPQCRQVLDLEW